MLEHHEFCDHCPGCRPVLLDVNTGQPLPADSPSMVKVDQVWASETTYEERKAFIEVTLHSSRSSNDLRLANQVGEKIKAGLAGLENDRKC
jgi:hypothetical protein